MEQEIAIMTRAARQKVLFLSPVGHFKGGAERSLMDCITTPSIEPILVAPHDGPLLEAGRALGASCHVLPFNDISTIRRPFSFLDGLQMMRTSYAVSHSLTTLAAETEADIVHSNGLKAHALNCLSRRMGGPPAVLHMRDIPYTAQEKLVWHVLYAMCSAMILVSRACWPGRVLPRKCRIIHNGIDRVGLRRQPLATLTPARGLTVGFVGRIHPAKGLHLLLQWLAAARTLNLNVRLRIHGTFSEDAPDYRDQVYTLIDTLDLRNIVDFAGYIPDREKVYENIDVVVVPSQVPDPLPRSVMEPMAAGIPVFGYPAGGIPDMIEDRKTGFFVSDESTFCSALQFIFENPDDVSRIVHQGLETIERQYSLDVFRENLKITYDMLTINSPARSAAKGSKPAVSPAQPGGGSGSGR